MSEKLHNEFLLRTQTFLALIKSGFSLQLICPLLRCMGNLLTSCPAENMSAEVGDIQIVAAVCTLLEAFLQTQPALARESAWVLNNLTGINSFCI